MKECSACHRTDVEFHKNSSKADGLQTICKTCKKERDATYYSSNKAEQRRRVKDRRRNIRQYMLDYLKTHPCVDCGEQDPIVLEFDHLGDKKINLSDIVSAGLCLDKVKEEIAKCDVRCANCHRRKTAKDFGWYKDLAWQVSNW
jgi:hypothetical protein